MDWAHALTEWEKMKCSKKTSKKRFLNKELNWNTLSVHQYQQIFFLIFIFIFFYILYLNMYLHFTYF